MALPLNTILNQLRDLIGAQADRILSVLWKVGIVGFLR